MGIICSKKDTDSTIQKNEKTENENPNETEINIIMEKMKLSQIDNQMENVEEILCLKPKNEFSKPEKECSIPHKFLKKNDAKKINIIIKNIFYWFFRKKFNKKEKESLKIIAENTFNEFNLSENIVKLRKLSQNIKTIFDELNGWKDFYDNFPIKYKELPKSKYEKSNNNNNNKSDLNNSNLINNSIYISEKEDDIKSNNFINIDIDNDNNIDLLKDSKLFKKTYFENRIFIKQNLDDEKVTIRKRKVTFAPEIENANDNNNKINKFINYNKIDKRKSYIYIGNVNKFGEKHGKGVLYYLDGISMEEGLWFNNHLFGWSRITYSNGIYFESKFFFNFY
jgi:hypothetical protein